MLVGHTRLYHVGLCAYSLVSSPGGLVLGHHLLDLGTHPVFTHAHKSVLWA
jgi:hypothetical protein